MNASKSILVLLAAACTFAWTAPAVAGPSAANLLLMSASLAQAKKTDRQEVESLLGQARAAFKEGKLDKAEEIITRAEKMHVEFSIFHLGDTPKKLRSELNAMKRNRKKDFAERPSHKFTPDDPNENSTELKRSAAKAASAQARPSTTAATGPATPDSEQPIPIPVT
ncbi:MAG TPA: hypothetical protein VGJ16_08885, partial [Pirellulales bacterium]